MKGLCFKYNEKYGSDHRCKFLFKIEAYQENGDEDVVIYGRRSLAETISKYDS